MNKIKSLILGSFIFLIALFIPVSIQASEGVFELRNTVGELARCWVGSVFMTNLRYKILVSCRDLVYPSGPEQLYNYILWAIPNNGRGYIKFGPLRGGKAEFETDKQFSEMIVSLEIREGGNQPSTPVVMRGFLERLTYLDPAQTPEEVALNETPTPTPIQSGPKTSAPNRLRVILPILFIAAFATMLMLYLITRFRR